MQASRQDTWDGLVVGGIAFATVAVFYAVFDVLAARGMLFTVNLLGGTLFGGMRDPSVLQLPIPIRLPGVVTYSALHLAASLLIGVVVVRMVGHAERTPAHARAVTAMLVSGFVATVAVVGWLSTPIRPLLPWWSIALANALAVIAGAAYLLRVRPGVAGRLLHPSAQGPATRTPTIAT